MWATGLPSKSSPSFGCLKWRPMMCLAGERVNSYLGRDSSPGLDSLYQKFSEYRDSAEGLSRAISPLQCCNVDLGHLHHRMHDALRLHGILVLQQFDHHARNDLPGQTELVLEPAALPRRAARGELRPQVVHFFLRVAVHDQGNGFGEFEFRTAVERGELLAFDLEAADQDRSGGPGSRLAVSRHAQDLRVLEDRDIVIHRLLGVAVEPEERRDFLLAHGACSFVEIRKTGKFSFSRSATRNPAAQSAIMERSTPIYCQGATHRELRS